MLYQLLRLVAPVLIALAFSDRLCQRPADGSVLTIKGTKTTLEHVSMTAWSPTFVSDHDGERARQNSTLIWATSFVAAGVLLGSALVAGRIPRYNTVELTGNDNLTRISPTAITRCPLFLHTFNETLVYSASVSAVVTWATLRVHVAEHVEIHIDVYWVRFVSDLKEAMVIIQVQPLGLPYEMMFEANSELGMSMQSAVIAHGNSDVFASSKAIAIRDPCSVAVNYNVYWSHAVIMVCSSAGMIFVAWSELHAQVGDCIKVYARIYYPHVVMNPIIKHRGRAELSAVAQPPQVERVIALHKTVYTMPSLHTFGQNFMPSLVFPGLTLDTATGLSQHSRLICPPIGGSNMGLDVDVKNDNIKEAAVYEVHATNRDDVQLDELANVMGNATVPAAISLVLRVVYAGRDGTRVIAKTIDAQVPIVSEPVIIDIEIDHNGSSRIPTINTVVSVVSKSSDNDEMTPSDVNQETGEWTKGDAIRSPEAVDKDGEAFSDTPGVAANTANDSQLFASTPCLASDADNEDCQVLDFSEQTQGWMGGAGTLGSPSRIEESDNSQNCFDVFTSDASQGPFLVSRVPGISAALFDNHLALSPSVKVAGARRARIKRRTGQFNSSRSSPRVQDRSPPASPSSPRLNMSQIIAPITEPEASSLLDGRLPNATRLGSVGTSPEDRQAYTLDIGFESPLGYGWPCDYREGDKENSVVVHNDERATEIKREIRHGKIDEQTRPRHVQRKFQLKSHFVPNDPNVDIERYTRVLSSSPTRAANVRKTQTELTSVLALSTTPLNTPPVTLCTQPAWQKAIVEAIDTGPDLMRRLDESVGKDAKGNKCEELEPLTLPHEVSNRRGAGECGVAPSTVRAGIESIAVGQEFMMRVQLMKRNMIKSVYGPIPIVQPLKRVMFEKLAGSSDTLDSSSPASTLVNSSRVSAFSAGSSRCSSASPVLNALPGVSRSTTTAVCKDVSFAVRKPDNSLPSGKHRQISEERLVHDTWKSAWRSERAVREENQNRILERYRNLRKNYSLVTMDGPQVEITSSTGADADEGSTANAADAGGEVFAGTEMVTGTKRVLDSDGALGLVERDDTAGDDESREEEMWDDEASIHEGLGDYDYDAHTSLSIELQRERLHNESIGWLNESTSSVF